MKLTTINTPTADFNGLRAVGLHRASGDLKTLKSVRESDRQIAIAALVIRQQLVRAAKAKLEAARTLEEHCMAHDGDEFLSLCHHLGISVRSRQFRNLGQLGWYADRTEKGLEHWSTMELLNFTDSNTREAPKARKARSKA